MGKNDSYFGKKNFDKEVTKNKKTNIDNIDKRIYDATCEIWGDINLKYASAEILRENPELPGIRIDNLIWEEEEKVKKDLSGKRKIDVGYFENKGDINLNDIRKYIRYAKGNTKRILMNIWLCLSKANAYSKSDLEEIEERVFTIGGRLLPEKERVRVEFIRINRYSRTDDFTRETLAGLKELYRTDYEDKKELIKKEIVRIEALLGMNIAFLNTSLEVAKEETRLISMEMEKVKTKKRSK